MKFIKYLLPIIILGLFSTQNVSALTPAISMQCPAELQLTENLRSGAYNGRYHSYTRGVVTQAHILQKHLNRLGFSSGIEDGKLGPISTGAIQRMQLSLNTKPDGIVGPLTRAVLNNSCHPGDFPVPCGPLERCVEPNSIPCGIDAPGCVFPSQQGATITTKSADSIDEDSANLRAQIQMNQSTEADIYFIYGTSESRVKTASRKNSFAQIDQSGERLKKLFVGGVYQTGSFSKKFSNLEENEEYYFTACIDSKEEPFRCGFDIKSFETGDLEFDFIPEIETEDSYYNTTGLNLESPIITGSFGNNSPHANYKVIPSFVLSERKSSLQSIDNFQDLLDLEWSTIQYIEDFDEGDIFENQLHNKQGISFYYRACAHYDVDENGSTFRNEPFVCGDIEYHQTNSDFDEEESAEKQARDAAAKAKLSQRRADIELYYIDNSTYNNAFAYITNLQLNTGNSYSLIYQSRGDTYTQYTALQTRDDLFCTDSTGYAGYTSSVLFGVSCNH